MRILFNSKLTQYKDPFGVLTEGEPCRLRLDIPREVGALRAEVVLEEAGTDRVLTFAMNIAGEIGDYQYFTGKIRLPRGLYFYYFRIYKPVGSFRLFKQGDDTNMEVGDRWQVSAIPKDAAVPEWAKGAVIYQIYPDRFYKSGECDLTGKIEPYTVHAEWGELPDWKPNEHGEITNSDFFGGNLRGIQEKLPYLKELGVDIVYLNPIFKAWSNHRYDTADYKVIDPMLGTEEDFTALCDAAHELGMHVILDGVFSHTGDRNPIFKDAVSNPDSPYRNWYQFIQWPKVYQSWWGITTLPCFDKTQPALMDYLIHDEDSVVARWLKLGADGWRLDVVDELPDDMVYAMKQRIREVKPDALLLGEVWEDASNKVAYGIRKRYFVDGELDSVMNYPLKNAILAYASGRDDGMGLKNTLEMLLENYPKDVLDCCMSLLSTHDTARILSVLVGVGEAGREVESVRRLSEEQRNIAKERLMLASFLQFMLPGAPSIYYGDETLMEGGKDPFNRKCYPWGKEDPEMMTHYKALCRLRKEEKALRTGDLKVIEAGKHRFGFLRDDLLIGTNRSSRYWVLGEGELLYGRGASQSEDRVIIAPDGWAVIRRTF